MKVNNVMNSDLLKKELEYLDLMEKAREIYIELGEGAVLSYIKSSYRLLSKVYHPDLNPKNAEKAGEVQQSLNKLSELIGRMDNREILDIFTSNGKTRILQEKAKKRKILIVEDEFGLQDMFRDIFNLEGYDVRVAIDGENGFEEFKKFEPDLIVTDAVMPNMSGLEMIGRIREINPLIKVIYISGFFGIRRLKQELDTEISKYAYPTLAKPFKTSAILELVKEYLAS
jgi:CheY-like chemotaxis protein